MNTPRVNINLKKIKENALIMKKKCRDKGIKLTGVVKGAAGDLQVFNTYIEAGITSIGDSRLQNIIKFRKAGYKGEVVLLRLPQQNEVTEVIKYVDISLVSEVMTIKALSRQAVEYGKKHGIIVMVDVGDLREGVLPEDIFQFFSQIIDLPGIEIKGLGTNVGCYGGVLPSRKNTRKLVELKESLEKEYSIKLPVISGGNTATTVLLDEGSLPEGINNFRVGEGILQGSDVTNQRFIKGLNHNNFTLTATIIELKKKPSVPIGEIGHDAFGNKPHFPDRGVRRRAILAIGKQDVKIDGLTPIGDNNIEILGASSDHLLVDITDSSKVYKVGDTIDFYLDYGAMLSVMTSSYVYKNYIK